ncbi:LysR family transcriptional regulator [Paraburkholderia bengalensis]|uniref:LysR family transcriptional regulator n=1 Tax=Paraburkholderia bengalensis TaxID=2747562 RepID=A0ABU8IXM4_9BURK
MDHLLSIRAFVAVVRFGTFTRAAWHLKMSMPALSRAVGNLEAHTQTRLLHRSTRHVLLADSARDYYTCCCKLLDCLHESELRLAKDRETPRGVIRVAVHPMAMESGLPQQVEVLRAEAPEIGLTMTVESGRLTLELGHYDVAVYPRLLISDTEAIRRKLISSPWMLVASDAYRRRGRKMPTADDFSGHMLISCDGAVSEREPVRLKCGDTVLTPIKPASQLVANESTAIRLALGGHGIALLPRITVNHYLEAGRLQPVFSQYEIERTPAQLDIAFIRRQPLPRRTRSFVDACLRHFSDRSPRPAKASPPIL